MEWMDYRTARPLSYVRDNIGAFPEKDIFELPAAVTDHIFQQAEKIAENPYIPAEREIFIAQARKLVRLIDPEIIRSISHELDHGFGAVLIKGLPIDSHLPQTPEKGGSLSPSYKNSFVSEAVLFAISELTGAEPFNFRQEGRGMAPLIDNIVPVRALKTQKGAGGFENNFPFHCESAWHRMRPDYLILSGIREDIHAKTLVFSSQMLDPASWKEDAHRLAGSFRLKAPELYFQMERSGMPMGTSRYSTVPPILFSGNNTTLNINFNGTDCLGTSAIEWLFRLEQFIEAMTVGTVLAPGSALILNNYLTCHTRTGYSPDFNGHDRWFIRGYLKKDLWDQKNASWDNPDDTKTLQQLMANGWMSEKGTLTTAFAKYVYEPDSINKLEPLLAELASVALNYTPVYGHRIV